MPSYPINILKNIVGKKIRLYKGTVVKDSYNRYLRYVTYITVNPITEWFVNDMLIKQESMSA